MVVPALAFDAVQAELSRRILVHPLRSQAFLQKPDEAGLREGRVTKSNFVS